MTIMRNIERVILEPQQSYLPAFVRDLTTRDVGDDKPWEFISSEWTLPVEAPGLGMLSPFRNGGNAAVGSFAPSRRRHES